VRIGGDGDKKFAEAFTINDPLVISHLEAVFADKERNYNTSWTNS